MGPSAITYEAIEAWMRLTGNRLLPWEVDAIKRLDAVWLKVQGEKQRQATSSR